MDIELIWAQDKKGGIGKNGTLPWHVSADLKNFKKITLESPIIMGRKTHESIGKILDGRVNVVLTKNPNFI